MQNFWRGFSLLASAALLMTAACATPPPNLPEPVSSPVLPAVEATVTRGPGGWRADFIFHQPAPVWAFTHSALLRDSRVPWRPQQWEVITPGVVLDQLGGREVLRMRDGGDVPAQVQIALRPASAKVEASYNPALVFSDGAVAMFSDQFDMVPIASVEAARNLPPDLNEADVPPVDVEVTWQDAAGPVLFKGQRQKAPSAKSADTYVLFGSPPAIETEAFTVIADAALPEWIQETILVSTPELINLYTDRLQLSPPVRPMVLASWNGPTPRIYSMGGSVMAGLIAIAFEGAEVVAPSDDLRLQAQLFLAHEAAHFWLGQLAAYEREADMWITEGGADLMAARALERLAPEFPVKDFLQTALDDCSAYLQDGPIVSANLRGHQRAHYVCGAVFAMVAEGYAREAGVESWLDVVAGLIQDNQEDRVITRAEWMDMLSGYAQRSDVAPAIARLLDEETPEPQAALSALLTGAGIGHEVTEGRIVLD